MSEAVLLSPSRDWSQIHARLRPRYDEPHRHYHGWAHVESLLEWLVEVHGLLCEPDMVHFAILYHDAIYDPRAEDNVAKSAALFHGEWGGALTSAQLSAVEAMILATETHELEPLRSKVPGPVVADCAYFLDMDLAILGSPPPDFSRYNWAIRKEYGHVPEEPFRRGRCAFLEKLLARPRIYASDYFFERLEAPARANLARTVTLLS